MDTLIEAIWGLWIFDLIGENPLLWAVVAYGVVTTVGALILIGRDEGGVIRYLAQEFRDIWRSSRTY